ncbi:hypothetical protein AMTR_s00003p00251710 [Amborella trichopoda]|uniref:Uncharacterized protein n=1 Tax=Amborella trichopoda TaxID=13333 RepID=W1P643_AMBTC|nr:hypothetical protein AMTR_s00003p00251710 [Amborella trichopoda]
MASSPSSLLSPTPKLHLIAPTPPRTPTPLSLNNPTPLSLLSLKNPNPTTANLSATSRRSLAISTISGILLSVAIPATSLAASDEEYVRETEDVINKVRNTINMEKGDPNVADAVAELREASNSWVAKYRREKELLAQGTHSRRDGYG